MHLSSSYELEYFLLFLKKKNMNINAALGPTNTGKTYYAIERMTSYQSGIIGLPLRLLTKEVFLTFENAIEEKKNNPNYQFYSIVVDEVTDVSVIDSLINITLKITSEQFKDNDETTISKKQDTWTFQKKINSNSPIWLLSST